MFLRDSISGDREGLYSRIGYRLGLYRDNGKENGSHSIIGCVYIYILGLHWDNVGIER